MIYCFTLTAHKTVDHCQKSHSEQVHSLNFSVPLLPVHLLPYGQLKNIIKMGVHTPTHKIILFIMEWKVSTKEKTMQLLCMNKVILKYLLEQCWLTSWGILCAFYSVLRCRRVVYVWLTWFLLFKNYVNRNIVAENIKTSLDKQDMQFLSEMSRFLA